MLDDRHYFRRPGSRIPAHAPVQEGPSLVVVLMLVNLTALVLRELFTASPSSGAVPAGAISVPLLQQGEWWTVFTHTFIHKDWPHLLLNMGLLFGAGRQVLADTGPRHFLYIYLISGWTAAAASLLLHQDSVLLGASGCVSGVVGAYAALHPERSVTAWLGAWAPRLRARNLFMGFVLVAIMLEAVALLTVKYWNLPLVHGVAHGGHAAGLLTGWLYARHLAPVLQALQMREDFFPQGLRRRNRETESSPVPARRHPVRRDNETGGLPSGLFMGGAADLPAAGTEAALDADPAGLEEDPDGGPADAAILTNDEFLRQAVDPVLDKLYAGGMASLTEQERRILDEAASRFARRSG